VQGLAPSKLDTEKREKPQPANGVRIRTRNRIAPQHENWGPKLPSAASLALTPAARAIRLSSIVQSDDIASGLLLAF
jgi:hypothetical protein